jgi:mannose-6-phosphate isomerase-like protein (cupin superfamily)
MDYSSKVVLKPWGDEYLLFENKKLGVWILNIGKGQKTSLHCHPNKKTGLALLEGRAIVSFLREPKLLMAGDKLSIHPTVFHSTEAISDVMLLEVESPNLKTDLVRIKDKYGRENLPYETSYRDRDLTSEPLITPSNPQCRLANCDLILEEFGNANLSIITEGGFEIDGKLIAGPGDLLTSETISLFHKEGSMIEGSKGISIYYDMV